jgi:hypothetical protein
MNRAKKLSPFPKTEYGKLVYYNEYSKETLGRGFRTANKIISNMLDNKHNSYFDLQELKASIIRCMNYCILYKKYVDLCAIAKEKLTVDNTGFHLDGHTFKTLKEVKAALQNRSLT